MEAPHTMSWAQHTFFKLIQGKMELLSSVSGYTGISSKGSAFRSHWKLGLSDASQ